MQLNSDDHANLANLVPPLTPLADEDFTKGVLIKTRLIKSRQVAMRVLAWTCLGLSLFESIPWQTAVNGIQGFIASMLERSIEQLEQLKTLTEGLQANLYQQTNLNESILLVTAILVLFAGLFLGALAED